jgi:hypothetical protein
MKKFLLAAILVSMATTAHADWLLQEITSGSSTEWNKRREAVETYPTARLCLMGLKDLKRSRAKAYQDEGWRVSVNGLSIIASKGTQSEVYMYSCTE